MIEKYSNTWWKRKLNPIDPSNIIKKTKKTIIDNTKNACTPAYVFYIAASFNKDEKSSYSIIMDTLGGSKKFFGLVDTRRNDTEMIIELKALEQCLSFIPKGSQCIIFCNNPKFAINCADKLYSWYYKEDQEVFDSLRSNYKFDCRYAPRSSVPVMADAYELARKGQDYDFFNNGTGWKGFRE